jgi:hypothetical protein
MKNRYETNCNTCREHVPAGAGTLSKATRFRRTFWLVTCPNCLDPESPDAEALAASRGDNVSFGVATSTGWVGYRNRRGRCEDAPCCGCCTF